jgi:hypothetical protein
MITLQVIYTMLPIDVVNHILSYMDSTVITQFDPKTHQEYFKINYSSGLCWKISANLLMKYAYPTTMYTIKNRTLYYHGCQYYENQLREQNVPIKLKRK